MGKLSSKKLLSAFGIAFFLWCASCVVCNAREVTDRRSSLATAAAATDDDSAAGSSLWLWRGPWGIPYWHLPPFPYHHPWPYLPPPHWPFWPRSYPRPPTPNPPSAPQTPIVKPAPPPPPTAKPKPTSAPPTPPTSPAKPTPPASPTPTPSVEPKPPASSTPTPQVEPEPPASSTPTPQVEPQPPASSTPSASPTPTPPVEPKPPASSTPPVSPTPPASPMPPASPTPPAVPTPPASPIPPASPTPPAAPTPPPVPSNSTTFNVLDFGAKGDGSTDDTKAFQDAWEASCNVEASTMVVPANYVFLVGPITFVGEHCQENIIFQLDGTVIAPTDPQAWADDGPENWLHFDKLSLFTLQGSGTVDGRGSVWWQRPRSEELDGDLYDVDDDDADHELDYEDTDIKVIIAVYGGFHSP